MTGKRKPKKPDCLDLALSKGDLTKEGGGKGVPGVEDVEGRMRSWDFFLGGNQEEVGFGQGRALNRQLGAGPLKQVPAAHFSKEKRTKASGPSGDRHGWEPLKSSQENRKAAGQCPSQNHTQRPRGTMVAQGGR